MTTAKLAAVLWFSISVFLIDGSQRPNIILFITDDQDILLGSMEFMPKTLKFMRQRGVEFENGFVSTPICCPSRSTIFTGTYAHVHNVMTNNQNCADSTWKETFERSTFAVYAQQAGYRTAFFGKYLNEYDGRYIPPGWNHWTGLVRNSRYYNYTVNVNGKREHHGFDYSRDYFTDLLKNSTIRYIEDSVDDHRPFLIVLSFPAPHGPEDPAPQFSTLFDGVETHRTAAWNYAPNPDKQWLLRHTGKMEPAHVVFTDLLHRRRLQTLQSVDDSVFTWPLQIMSLIRSTNQLQNTFVIFTSDHGYHLGQFGLLKGKSLPYEFDIRVPFFIRGPGLPRGVKRKELVGNIDLAPTILAIAGVRTPANMSGRSILDLFSRDLNVPWRHTILIERGKMPNKLWKVGERLERQRDRFDKLARLDHHCAKPKNQGSCKEKQDWVCEQNPSGRWRIRKCRSGKCKCHRVKRDIYDEVDESVEVSQLEDEFLQQNDEEEIIESGGWFQGVFGVETDGSAVNGTKRKRRSLNSTSNANVACRLNSDSTCEIPSSLTRERWDREKTRVDRKIQKLMNRLFAYKDYRKVLKSAKPLSSISANETCNCDRQTERHPLRQTRWSGRPARNCTQPQMNCFNHSAEHWRTPPFWPPALGSFCFCSNSNNNSYFCLRTVNETHNFLFCEFITGFLSFYDLNEDPDQLTNVVFQLNTDLLAELSTQLLQLRSCRSAAECEHFSSSNWRRSLPQDVRIPN